MTEETYRRLMLKHAQQQTALMFALFSKGNNLNTMECIIQCKKECEELDKETDEALKETDPSEHPNSIYTATTIEKINAYETAIESWFDSKAGPKPEPSDYGLDESTGKQIHDRIERESVRPEDKGCG